MIALCIDASLASSSSCMLLTGLGWCPGRCPSSWAAMASMPPPWASRRGTLKWLPRVKWLVFWSPHATAKASPSTGAYLDSTLVVNLLPEYTVFHPFLQQLGFTFWHSHNFCDRYCSWQLIGAVSWKKINSVFLCAFYYPLFQQNNLLCLRKVCPIKGNKYKKTKKTVPN